MAALPYDVTVEGSALLDFGLQGLNHVEPIALLTFGLLWPTDSIWSTCDPSITTNWATCDASITTNWTTNDPSIVTTWTENG